MKKYVYLNWKNTRKLHFEYNYVPKEKDSTINL